MAMTDDRIFVDGAGQKVPRTVSDAPNNGHRLRMRCISALYRDSMSREGGMRVVQTAPRGSFWRVMADWWPQIAQWLGGRPSHPTV